MHLWEHVPGERLDVARVPHVGEAKDHVLDADLGQGAEPIDRLGRSLAPEVDRLQVRPLDLPERPAYLGAALAQDRELVGQLIRPAENVAGVFCSPPPPMRIFGCGLLIACGEFSSRVAW